MALPDLEDAGAEEIEDELDEALISRLAGPDAAADEAAAPVMMAVAVVETWTVVWSTAVWFKAAPRVGPWATEGAASI